MSKSILKIESDGIKTTLEINGMKIPITYIKFEQGINEIPDLTIDVQLAALYKFETKEKNDHD